jgi:hypothetical protein
MGCKGADCSMRDNPDAWEGFPGCAPTGNATGPGWQLCPALGFGQLMSLLPNSSAGMQWSERWRQPYFSVPAGVYPSSLAKATSATIFIDNATSMVPKYEMSIRESGGFGIWTADAAGVESGDFSGGRAGQAMWEAIPSPYNCV